MPIKPLIGVRKRSAAEKSWLFLSRLEDESEATEDCGGEEQNEDQHLKCSKSSKKLKVSQTIEPSCSSVKPAKRERPKKNVSSGDKCGSCSRKFSEDQHGQNWIYCTECREWFHEKCQGLSSYQWNFKCLGCNFESD